MIIALSYDDTTTEMMRHMATTYPEDTIALFKNFLVTHDGQIRVEKNGGLPTRFSFVGHADASPKEYGGMAPNEFAETVIAELEEAGKINPNFKKMPLTIDLIGCETGLVNQNGASYALDVAKTMLEKGFTHVQVKAFTNLSVESAQPCCAQYVEIFKNTVLVYGFSTQEDDDAFTQFQDIDRKKFLKKIDSLKAELMEIRSLKSQAQKKNDPIAQEKIKKEPQIRESIKKLESSLIDRHEQMEKKRIPIKETKDIRSTLDEDVKCDFSNHLHIIHKTKQKEIHKLQGLTHEKSKLELELKSLESQGKELRAAYERAVKNSDAPQIKKLEKTIETLVTKAYELKSSIQSTTENINKLQKEIDATLASPQTLPKTVSTDKPTIATTKFFKSPAKEETTKKNEIIHTTPKPRG